MIGPVTLVVVLPGFNARGAWWQRLAMAGDMEATTGFEPVHSGFADRPLNHLGTAPKFKGQTHRATTSLARPPKP